MKTKTIIAIVVKAFVVITIIIGFDIFMQSIVPEIVNILAIEQMTNNPESSTLIRVFSIVMNYIWVVELLSLLIAFLPEIIKLAKYIIRKIRKENNDNEENY